MRSPKQPSSAASNALYPYYAGFSDGFVSDVIDRLELGSEDTLLDPWNGAGTTTRVASARGVSSYGTDANPGMVVVAKASLIGEVVAPSEVTLAQAVVDLASAMTTELPADDPLSTWFLDSAALPLRRLERAVGELFDPAYDQGPPSAPQRVSDLSPLAAFFYVCLFRTARRFALPLVSSNPTWIRRPKTDAQKVGATTARVFRAFRAEVTAAASAARASATFAALRSGSDIGRTSISVADSRSLPFENHTVTAVIASPPYCTRIDYAIATSIDLAILGMTKTDFNTLRKMLMGSAVTTHHSDEVDIAWGPTCADFLHSVYSHPSKASRGYYLRTHLQYFADLNTSLVEIDRVMQGHGRCVLVVQDSYYKDVHNDLPRIVTDMAEGLGWRSDDRVDFVATRNMARLNRRLRPYRKAHPPVESALFLSKT